MNKIVAVAAAAVIAISAMAMSVSATTNISYWSIVPSSSASSNYYIGTITGLDVGITFTCTDFFDPTSVFAAKVSIPDSILFLHQSEYFYITQKGECITILFRNDWYKYCNGTVSYRIDAVNPIANSGQRIKGTAR